MTATAENLWQHRLRPGAAGGAEIVCFPHAGGAANFYRPLAMLLDESLPVTAIQYPGRQERLREPLIPTIDALADGVYAALRPAERGPMALFGHSMGATLAFEVARRMERHRGAGPVALFVSGRRPPSRPRRTAMHRLDDDALAAQIVAAGGTDERLLAEPGMREMILRVVRNDYRAIETYEYRPGPPLRCPIVALRGEDDPAVTEDEARAWAGHTEGPFTPRVFPGGHFYLTGHLREIAAEVSGVVRGFGRGERPRPH